MRSRAQRLARVAVSATLYVVLSLVSMPLTFGMLQIRFSEMLVLLCFYNRDYCYAMVLGCIITNIFSPFGWIDVLFGSFGTLLAVCLIRLMPRIYLAWIPPTVCGFMVALEMLMMDAFPFWAMWLAVAIGEIIAVGVIGVPVFMLLSRSQKFLEVIGVDKRYLKIQERIEQKSAVRKKKKVEKAGSAADNVVYEDIIGDFTDTNESQENIKDSNNDI